MTVAAAPISELDQLRGWWLEALADPMLYLSRFVFTLDQQDKVQPFKSFPADRPYVKALVALWLDNPLLVGAKSRQMMITWLFCALHLWIALKSPGQLIFLQSKKEEDAIGNESAGTGLLGRTKYILHHIPCWKALLPPVKESANMIEFVGRNSVIWAIPQGPDIIRQHTPSAIFSDEAAFQENFEEAYTAAMACVRGGARFTVISSAFPGAFERLYLDEMDNAGY
jgi:hypothetical protein